MTKRIFVVDDERIIADSLATILNSSGYETSAFYDAESALLGPNPTLMFPAAK
jgi:DNA-binding NtrC family response regulator